MKKGLLKVSFPKLFLQRIKKMLGLWHKTIEIQKLDQSNEQDKRDSYNFKVVDGRPDK